MSGNTHGLIERCIRREEKAWEEFIERFSGLLYYSAKKRLQKSGMMFMQQDVEDIVQAVFMDIWEKQHLEKVKDRKKITAWLSVTAQNRALNYMRQKREMLLREEDLYKINNLRADGKGCIDEELIVGLDKCIEDFEPRHKIVLKLNIIYGKTHKEIARFMNMPMSTVATIIARKKKKLKFFLME